MDLSLVEKWQKRVADLKEKVAEESKKFKTPQDKRNDINFRKLRKRLKRAQRRLRLIKKEIERKSKYLKKKEEPQHEEVVEQAVTSQTTETQEAPVVPESATSTEEEQAQPVAEASSEQGETKSEEVLEEK